MKESVNNSSGWFSFLSLTDSNCPTSLCQGLHANQVVCENWDPGYWKWTIPSSQRCSYCHRPGYWGLQWLCHELLHSSFARLWSSKLSNSDNHLRDLIFYSSSIVHLYWEGSEGIGLAPKCQIICLVLLR